jgi:hypothetical protein
MLGQELRMYDNPLNGPPTAQPPAYSPPPMGAGPANYYAPPIADYDAIPDYQEEGSYGLGIAVGFIFSLIGLIIVLIAGKSATKRGALHGFLARLGLSFVILAITGVFF